MLQKVQINISSRRDLYFPNNNLLAINRFVFEKGNESSRLRKVILTNVALARNRLAP
jgi:hypothetical protein